MAKKKSSKLIYILIAVVVVLIVAAIIGKKSGVVGKAASKKVEVAEANQNTIIEKVNASGTVQPVTEVKLSPDVAGEIIVLNVEEGDPVEKGDLLIRIRPDNFENAVQRAKANLNQQRANLAQARAALERAKAQKRQVELTYERQKQLRDENVISEADFETAEANYEVAKNDLKSAQENVQAAQYIVQSAQASVDEAQENLSRTSVYAPVSGTVSKLSVELGERVVGTQQMAGTEMLRIANLNNMEVRVDVNENDIIRIEEGDTAIIEVDSYTFMEKKFKGIVTAIANTAKEKASQDAVTEFEVKVLILNESYEDLVKEGKDSPFRPGMTASVEIITETKQDVLTVPLSAVTLRKPVNKNDSTATKKVSEEKEREEEVVFVVVKDDKVKQVQVETGISDFENIEILSGLSKDDMVVKGPFLVVSKTLKDGDLVEYPNSSKKKEKESSEEEE